MNRPNRYSLNPINLGSHNVVQPEVDEAETHVDSSRPSKLTLAGGKMFAAYLVDSKMTQYISRQIGVSKLTINGTSYVFCKQSSAHQRSDFVMRE